MDIQSAALNAIFVLFPVHIPGWVSPVKPADLAHGGIPKSLYDGQVQGLECLVDPWQELQLLSRTMAVDDRVDLYVNDDPTPVTGKTVAPGEEQQRIRLYVPHGRLRNGVNRLHYKVTRVSGNSSEDSRDLNVLYYLRTPGEPAPQGLDLVIPPDVIKDGVSAARAAQGVAFGFTYSNRRAYDRIRFQLGDESVDWEITDASVPVTKTLFTDAFQQVGDNPYLQVDFRVFDQLGNSNQSSTKEIDVHLGRLNLSAAILREIPSENNDDPNTVDLAKLNGNPLSALIHLIETIWKVGDSIKLVFTAELNGGVVATHEETSPITQVPSQFVWSIPNNKIIARSTLTVVYQLVRNGTVIATSTPARAQVIGEPVVDERPTITSVRKSGGSAILPGDTITDVNVTLEGKASKGQLVQILNMNAAAGPPVQTSQTDGRWTVSVTVAVGSQSFTAKALYGSKLVSTPPWHFNVVRPLIIDTSTMELNGLAVYVSGWNETDDPINNNNATRRPTTGQLPITYKSGNSSIAFVSQEGKVTGRMNGSTYIEVEDANGSAGKYPVTVSNVYQVVFSPTMLTPQQAVVWAREQGQTGDAILLNRFISPMSIRYDKYKVDNLPQYPSMTQMGNDGYVRRGWVSTIRVDNLNRNWITCITEWFRPDGSTQRSIPIIGTLPVNAPANGVPYVTSAKAFAIIPLNYS